jgi:hypothetical protein
MPVTRAHSRPVKRRLSSVQLAVRRALADDSHQKLSPEESRRVIAAGVAAGTIRFPAGSNPPFAPAPSIVQRSR